MLITCTSWVIVCVGREWPPVAGSEATSLHKDRLAGVSAHKGVGLRQALALRAPGTGLSKGTTMLLTRGSDCLSA